MSANGVLCVCHYLICCQVITQVLGAAQRLSPAVANLNAGDVFAVSAAAKLGATVLTYPILLVKSRLMSAGRHTSADRVYKGTAHAIACIWQTEGANSPAEKCHATDCKSVQYRRVASLCF